MRSLSYAVAIFFLTVSVTLNAQKIPFDNYTIHQGLPQNSVFDITQDAYGYIWFATQIGASRFDGREFLNFSVNDGLPENYINQLLSDSRQRMWFGTDGGGVARYDGNRFTVFNRKMGLVDDKVEELCEDHAGNVWVRTHYGISRISPGDSIVTFTQKNGLIHNNAICMYEDDRGRMWIGTQEGISVFEGNSIKNLDLTEVVWGIDQDSRGNYWIATQESGIYRYDGKDFTHFTTADGLCSDIVISIFVDSKDRVWCGTYRGGVSMYDGKKFVTHRENGLGGAVIMQFFEDSRGNLWSRPSENGIYRLRKNTFQHLDKSNNLVDNYVLKIYEDNQHNLWFGTLGGVSRYSKFTFEVYQDADGLMGNNIFSVMVDRDGNVWAGSNAGISMFDRKRFTKWGNREGLPDFTVTRILQDRQGNIWAAGFSTLSLIGEKKVKVFSDTAVLDQKIIYDLAEDDDGRIWCATEQGIFCFEDGHFTDPFRGEQIMKEDVRGIMFGGGRLWAATGNGVYTCSFPTAQWRHFTVSDGLAYNKCRDITRDEQGTVWVATDGGLSAMTEKNGEYTFRNFTTEDGLVSNTLYFVISDGLGRIWVGHEKGLNRLDVATGTISSYGVLEGFTPLETNQGAVAVDRKHNLWIGTVAGLAHYDPAYENISTTPPITFVRRILLFNKEVDFTPFCDSLDPRTHLPVNLVLPYNRNNLTFEFIGLQFTIPEEVSYRYFLKGFDREWSPATPDNRVTYRKIPPGQYTFMVRAGSYAGVWNEEPYTFSFRITPPFWQTTWFILLMILLGILLVFQIIKIREKQLIREKRILEEKVRQRTKKIEKQKEELESQRDRIAQQNREIKDSIYYAKRIQTAVLPDLSAVSGMLKDYFILFRPRDIVSGDFYWLYREGQKVIVVAADCTGHGVPGAFMSMLGVSLLSEIVNKDKIFQANLILNSLRDYIKGMLGQTGKMDEAKDGMDMALVILDYGKKEIQYAGAYNPLILIRNGGMLEYKGDKMPIGIQINEKESFTNHIIPMQPGDTLYIFSDGYADQFGGEDGRKFKIRHFKELLLEIHRKPMPEQKKILEETLLKWMGDHSQLDDILVIGLRP